MKFFLLLSLSILILFNACGGGSGAAKVQIKNAKDVNTRGVQSFGADDQTSELTIDSLKVPIFDVGLSFADELYGSSESGYLYTCEGDCDVELVGPALENLLTGGTNGGDLEAGKTYSSVMLATCTSGATSYTAKLKAKATVAGTPYYTKTGAQYMTTVEADYSPVEITFNSCRNYTVLSNPIAYDGTEVTVSLYIDLRNIAHVYHPTSTLYSSSASSNCSVSGSPSGQPYICLEYPNVGGTISSGAPTIERYKLANAASSGLAPQLVGFYFDTDGNPIGGYSRVYIADVVSETIHLTTPQQFKKTRLEGTSLFFTDYSGGSPDTALGSGTSVSNQASTNGNFTVESFPRPAVGAAAQSITTIKDTNGTASTVNYSVTRID